MPKVEIILKEKSKGDPKPPELLSAERVNEIALAAYGFKLQKRSMTEEMISDLLYENHLLRQFSNLPTILEIEDARNVPGSSEGNDG